MVLSAEVERCWKSVSVS